MLILLQEDDEHTIEEVEAVITKEEREEELAALQNEMDLPLEELLKRYAVGEGTVWLISYCRVFHIHASSCPFLNAM